jgi:hypothetical protein
MGQPRIVDPGSEQRFKVRIADHYLKIAHEGAVLQGVGGEGVPEVVRRNASQVTAIGRRSHGALYIGFMAAPAHEDSGAWVATSPAAVDEARSGIGASGACLYGEYHSSAGNHDLLGVIWRRGR